MLFAYPKGFFLDPKGFFLGLLFLLLGEDLIEPLLLHFLLVFALALFREFFVTNPLLLSLTLSFYLLEGFLLALLFILRYQTFALLSFLVNTV